MTQPDRPYTLSIVFNDATAKAFEDGDYKLYIGNPANKENITKKELDAMYVADQTYDNIAQILTATYTPNTPNKPKEVKSYSISYYKLSALDDSGKPTGLPFAPLLPVKPGDGVQIVAGGALNLLEGKEKTFSIPKNAFGLMNLKETVWPALFDTNDPETRVRLAKSPWLPGHGWLKPPSARHEVSAWFVSGSATDEDDDDGDDDDDDDGLDSQDTSTLVNLKFKPGYDLEILYYEQHSSLSNWLLPHRYLKQKTKESKEKEGDKAEVV